MIGGVLGDFQDLDPVLQAFLAGGVTWLLTAVGAALVVFAARVP